MPGQHKYKAITIRPSDDEREWLESHAEKTGRDVNSVVREALSEYRSLRTSPEDQEAGK
jgi:predicted transcriptional regulator